MLRPYRHVLQRGGRRAPTPFPHHAVDPGSHSITFGSEGSFLPSAGLRRSHSIVSTMFSGLGSRYCSSSGAAPTWHVLSFNDQHRAFERCCSARLQGQEGFFFASSINTMQGQPGFFFASRLDTAQVHQGLLLREQHRHDARPARLLFREQPRHASSPQAFKDQRASSSRAASQEVGCADGLNKRKMCFSRTLCETCLADSLRPANMQYLQVRQRVGGARYMYAV